jgi:RHS repeat-associated protein
LIIILNVKKMNDKVFHSIPFGELFISQRNSSFDSRYKFTAKELDNETNYTYFGARYYDSDISIWLSACPPKLQRRWMDPLSDKYPSLSPYAYCANNPVILVDPDGRDIEPTFFRGQNGESSAAYAKQIIDQGLDGQFEAYLYKGQNGNPVLGIKATKGGGDFSKMSESALAFYDELSTMINDHSTTVKIDVFYGNSDVTTGKYKDNAIDVADMMQYNIDNGATRAGKMVHELKEQYYKAKDGIPKEIIGIILKTMP